MKPTPPPEVAAVLDSYPPALRKRLSELRQLILKTAQATEGVGEIEETLKWGKPAFLTTKSKSGSTIRIGPVRGEPHRFGLFFNCQTSLVESFRQWYEKDLDFDGNRCIVLGIDDPLPSDLLSECIGAALTYHRDKGRKGRRV